MRCKKCKEEHHILGYTTIKENKGIFNLDETERYDFDYLAEETTERFSCYNCGEFLTEDEGEAIKILEHRRG